MASLLHAPSLCLSFLLSPLPSDDMPAHVKSSVFGCSVTVPITGGSLNLGTWQGIWLGEHRDEGGARRIVVRTHDRTNNSEASLLSSMSTLTHAVRVRKSASDTSCRWCALVC